MTRGTDRILNKQKKLFFLFLISFVFIITVFIFANSLSDYETSHSSSSNITEIISSTTSDNKNIEFIVRKTAHLAEFALLGIAVMLLLTYWKKQYYGGACFYVLAIAVIDEHIQSFSGRTSFTGDIILDFVGAILGFLMVVTIKLFASLIKRKINRISRR